jgi:hypothetical protein
MGTIGIAFDSLSPYVVEAIKKLETKVITNLKDNVRETVRQHIERGLTEGLSPKQMSKGLREIIGLAPNQELAVENYRLALLGGKRSSVYSGVFDAKLRDRRFDTQLAHAMLNRKKLTPEQVEKMVGAYRQRMINHNALTNAKTAALDTQKLAQKLSWQSAIDQGIVDGDRLQKTWVGIMDDREREEHRAMEGQTVPFFALYSNGEDVPGESTWNCWCLSRITQRRA